MTRITKPGEYQLVKYTTGTLAKHFDLNARDMKMTFQLNVDPQGFPKSFWLQKPYYASAQSYWDGRQFRSTSRFFKNQKWSIFKIFQTGGPIEENGAFIGEMHASGQWEDLVTYTVRRLDFTFLRAYRSDLREPFRRAATLTKLSSP